MALLKQEASPNKILFDKNQMLHHFVHVAYLLLIFESQNLV